MGGRSHPPWREVCSEILGPPGPLGSAGGGRDGWGAGSGKGAPPPPALRPVAPPTAWPLRKPRLYPHSSPAVGLSGNSRGGQAWTHRASSRSPEGPHSGWDLQAWCSPAPTYWESQRHHAGAAEDSRNNLGHPRPVCPGAQRWASRVYPSCVSLSQYLKVESLVVLGFFLGHVQVSPVRVALGKRCVSTPQVLCALPAGAAVDPCPASQLEKRSGSGPCQPPGSACGPPSWNPTAGEGSRVLGHGDGSPGVTGELVASLKYQEPCKHGAAGGSASARPPTLFPCCLAHCGGVGQPDPRAHSLGKAFS